MNKLRRRCINCKIVKTVGEDVFWQDDPFQSEIRGDYTKMWLCTDCARESAMEI